MDNKVIGKLHVIIYDKNGNKIREIFDENESTLYFDLFAGKINLTLYPIEKDIKRIYGDNVNSYLKTIFGIPASDIVSNRFNFTLTHDIQNKRYSVNGSFTNNAGNDITIYGFATVSNNILTTIYLFNEPLLLERDSLLSLTYIIIYPRTGSETTITIKNFNIENLSKDGVVPFNVKLNPSYRLARYNRVIIKNTLKYGFNSNYILGIQSQVNVNITSTHPEYKALKSFNEIINDNSSNVLKDKLDSQLVGEFFYWIRQSGGIGVAKARRFILINSGLRNIYGYHSSANYNVEDITLSVRLISNYESYFKLNLQTAFLNNKIKYYPWINTQHINDKKLNVKYKSKQIKVKLFNLNFINFSSININNILHRHNNYYNSIDYNNWIYFKRINQSNSINIYSNNINQNNIYYNFNFTIHSYSLLFNFNELISRLNSQGTINNAFITFCYNSGKIVGVENIPLNTNIYTDRGEQLTVQDAIGKTLFGNILYFEHTPDENNPSYVIFETSSENNGVEEYELGYENIYLQIYGYNGIFFDKLRKRIYTTVYGEPPNRIIGYQYRIAYEYDNNTNKLRPILSNLITHSAIDEVFTNLSTSQITQIQQTHYFNNSKLVLVFLKHPSTGEITYTIMTLKEMLDITGSTINIDGVNYLIDWEIEQTESIDNLIIDFTGSINFNVNEYITFQINDNDYLINSTALETYNIRDGDTIIPELAQEFFSLEDEDNAYVKVETASNRNKDTTSLNPFIDRNKLNNSKLKYRDYIHEFNDNHLILVYLVQNPLWTQVRSSSDFLENFNINGRIVLPVPKVIKKDNIEYIVDLRDITITDGYNELDWSLSNTYQYFIDTKNKEVGFSDLLSSISTQNYWLIEIPISYFRNYSFDYTQQNKLFYVFIQKKTINDLLPLNLTFLNITSDNITNGIACIRLPFVLPNTIRIMRTDTNTELSYTMFDEHNFRNIKYSNVVYVKVNSLPPSTFSAQNILRYDLTDSKFRFYSEETRNCGIINPRLIQAYGDGYILTNNHTNKIISNNTQSLAISGHISASEQAISTFGNVPIRIENTANIRSQNYRTFFDFVYEYGIDNITDKFTFVSGNINSLRFTSYGIAVQQSNVFHIKGNIIFNQPHFAVKIKGNLSGLKGTTNNTEGLSGNFYSNYEEHNTHASEYVMYRIGNYTSNHGKTGINNYIIYPNFPEYISYSSRTISTSQGNEFSFRFKNTDTENLRGGNFIYFNKVLAYKHSSAIVKELYENPYNYVLSSFVLGYQNSIHNYSKSTFAEVSLLALIDTNEVNPKRKVFLYVPERYMNKSLLEFTNALYIYDYNENKGLFDKIQKQNVRVYTYFDDAQTIIQNSGFENDLIKEFNYFNPFVFARKIFEIGSGTDFAQIVLGYPYEILHSSALTNASPIINLKFLKDKLGERYYSFKNPTGTAITFTSVPQGTMHATSSTPTNENDEFILLHHNVYSTITSSRTTNNNLDMRYTPFPSHFNFYAINKNNGRIYKFNLGCRVVSANFSLYSRYNISHLSKIISYQKSSEWLSTSGIYSSALEPVFLTNKYVDRQHGFYSINSFNTTNLNYPLPVPHIVNGIFSTNIENQYVDYPHVKRYYLTKQTLPTQSSSIPSGTNGFLTNFFEIYWYKNTQINNTPIFFTKYIDLDKVNNVELIDPVFITNAPLGNELNMYIFMRILNTQTNIETIYGIENNTMFKLVDITQSYNSLKLQQNINVFDNGMSSIYGLLKPNVLSLKPFWKWIKDNISENERNKYRISFGIGFRFTQTYPIQMKFFGINLLIDLTDKSLYRNLRWNWFNTNIMNISNQNDANTIIIEPIPSNYFIVEHDNTSYPDTTFIVNTSDIHDRTKPFRILNLISGMNIKYMNSYTFHIFGY